jgi:hypothetical protein
MKHRLVLGKGHAMAVMTCGLAILAGCASAPEPAPAPAVAAPTRVAAVESAASVSVAYGIEFLDTRLSAANHVVDLRYRVLDSDKAAPLLDRKIKPVLVNAKNGHRYYVPQPPIVGALRQTTRNQAPPQVGRTYFMLFANPDGELKAGDALALYVGDQRVGNFVLR